MNVSVLLLTIDRYHLTRDFAGEALKHAGYPFELCITDNGSKEPEIFRWCEEQKPTLYIKNHQNKGTAQSLNRMIEENPADAWVFIGNDIEMPRGWLGEMVQQFEKLPEETGVMGIDWRGQEYEIAHINGHRILRTDKVFGAMFISKKLRGTIGKFCEEYGVYGLWDSDYSIRSRLAGFENYYVPGLRSHHKGNDVGDTGAYRKMKDNSLHNGVETFESNVKKYYETKMVFI